MKNKKILYVITKSNFGGAQKYVFELATEMKNLGHDVSVALGGNGILIEKLENAGVRVIKIDSLERDVYVFKDLKNFFTLFAIFRKEKPDVIHLNSSKIGAIGAIAGRLAGIKKIIFTIHGWAFNEDRPRVSKLIIKKIYWWTIFMCHKVIAVSEKTKGQIKQIPFGFILKEKISVIKNEIRNVEFVDQNLARKFFTEKIIDLHLQFSEIPPNTKIIGTLSELHPIKGLEYLITAVKNIPNIIVLIFGEGDERDRLEKQIDILGLKEKVFLLGFVKDASKYLKGLDLFTLTSNSEASPLCILEAKQAGLPIVASNVGGIPEALENYPNYRLTEPRNVIDIKSAIEEILSKNILTDQNQNNFQKMIEEILNIYK